MDELVQILRSHGQCQQGRFLDFGRQYSPTPGLIGVLPFNITEEFILVFFLLILAEFIGLLKQELGRKISWKIKVIQLPL